MNKNLPEKQYTDLISRIGHTFQKSKQRAVQTIHNEMLLSYWEIGKHIVEFEQKGKQKADYGDELIKKLSKDLKVRYGKGFSRSNLIYMRLFYIKYEKGVTVSHLLTWSHYYELIKIEDDLERSFYEKQIINENWSVRELRRQKKTALFQRIALSKNKEEILQLSKEGLIPKIDSHRNL